MGTKSSRERKITWINSSLDLFFKTNPDGEIDEEWFVSTFAIENFSTARTAREILKDFVNTKKIIIENKKIMGVRK